MVQLQSGFLTLVMELGQTPHVSCSQYYGSILRIDIGFYLGMILYPFLKSLYRFHVLFAVTLLSQTKSGTPGSSQMSPGVPK